MNLVTANTKNTMMGKSNIERVCKIVVGTALTSTIAALFIMGGDFLLQNAHSLALENIGANWSGFQQNSPPGVYIKFTNQETKFSQYYNLNTNMVFIEKPKQALLSHETTGITQ